MVLRKFLLTLSVALVGLVTCPARRATAQVVMLPSYHVFTVSTSVLVPDRGMAFRGGVSTARESRTSRGVPGFGQLPMAGPLFANRGIGRELGNAGAHVTATIIDQGEMDRQVLGLAARSRPVYSAADVAIARKAAFLNQHIASSASPALSTRSLAGLPANHISQIRQQQQRADQQQQLEGLELMILGQQMELAGKLGVAKIYYQQAVRRLTGTRQQQLITRLQQLSR